MQLHDAVQGVGMDYRCMLDSLGNSSTALLSSDRGGTVGSYYSYAVRTSFFLSLAVLLLALLTFHLFL